MSKSHFVKGPQNGYRNDKLYKCYVFIIQKYSLKRMLNVLIHLTFQTSL